MSRKAVSSSRSSPRTSGDVDLFTSPCLRLGQSSSVRVARLHIVSANGCLAGAYVTWGSTTSLSAFNVDTSSYVTMSNAFVDLNSGAQDVWFGSLLGPDGKIYFIPCRYGAICTIETGIPSQQPWMMAPEFNKY